MDYNKIVPLMERALNGDITPAEYVEEMLPDYNGDPNNLEEIIQYMLQEVPDNMKEEFARGAHIMDNMERDELGNLLMQLKNYVAEMEEPKEDEAMEIW